MRVTQSITKLFSVLALVTIVGFASGCEDDLSNCEGPDCALSTGGGDGPEVDTEAQCVAMCENVVYTCGDGTADFEGCIAGCGGIDDSVRSCMTNFCGDSLGRCVNGALGL